MEAHNHVFDIDEMFDTIFGYVDFLDHHAWFLVCKQFNKRIRATTTKIKSREEYIEECEKGNYLAITHTDFSVGELERGIVDASEKSGNVDLFLYLTKKYKCFAINSLCICLIGLYNRTYPRHWDYVAHYQKIIREMLPSGSVLSLCGNNFDSLSDLFKKIDYTVKNRYIGEFLVNGKDFLNSKKYTEVTVKHNQCGCVGCWAWSPKIFDYLIASKKPVMPNTILLTNVSRIKVNAKTCSTGDRAGEKYEVSNTEFTIRANGTLLYSDLQKIRESLAKYKSQNLHFIGTRMPAKNIKLDTSRQAFVFDRNTTVDVVHTGQNLELYIECWD